MNKAPSKEEIISILAFLPKLYAPGFNPVKKWGGGNKLPNGAIHIPFPIYDTVVNEFINEASKECWQDYRYAQKGVSNMFKNPEIIKEATISQLKSMLTYIVRGERFCDGH